MNTSHSGLSDDSAERDIESYRWPTLFGVPMLKSDREKAVKILARRLKGDFDIAAAMTRVLDNNERVVSRCAVLVQFNSITIAILLFVGSNPRILNSPLQKNGFYACILAWLFGTMALMFSLRHIFPDLKDIDRDGDLILTCRLYLRRMLVYNYSLLYSLAAFAASIAFLSIGLY
jgi:hypothetical protein